MSQSGQSAALAPLGAAPRAARTTAGVSVDRSNPVERVVEQARAGDKDAFGQLYQMYYAPIFRLARFYLPDHAAEDVVAETFLRAWAALPRHRDTELRWLPWLYGIARHVVADSLKAMRRSAPHAHVPDRAYDPAILRDDRLALRSALARLPESQRRVIDLKFLLGMNNHEIAQEFGTTPAAVNALQTRALVNLRRMGI